MNTFNLMQVADFPTRITNNNGTLIDTILVDTTMYDKIQVKPCINAVSDHDAQIICLQNANIGLQQSVSKKKSRLINEQTIKHFQTLLKDETWDTVCKTTCINEIYNGFQGIFLRHYETSFLVFYTNYPLSYGVSVRERYGSTLLPATREQHDQNCIQSH